MRTILSIRGGCRPDSGTSDHHQHSSFSRSDNSPSLPDVMHDGMIRRRILGPSPRRNILANKRGRHVAPMQCLHAGCAIPALHRVTAQLLFHGSHISFFHVPHTYNIFWLYFSDRLEFRYFAAVGFGIAITTIDNQARSIFTRACCSGVDVSTDANIVPARSLSSYRNSKGSGLLLSAKQH